MRLPVLLDEVRACRVCERALPLGPRPLVQLGSSARVLIIGQAPGRVAHETGVPWSDRSGDRLREWMGVERRVFYDPGSVALMPMGFCYPGPGPSGDLPPRPECAPFWHDRLRRLLPDVSLTILVGRFAYERYLAEQFDSLTVAVRSGPALLPTRIALPHPSPRNNLWLRRNPWFEARALPALRAAVSSALGATPSPRIPAPRTAPSPRAPRRSG